MLRKLAWDHAFLHPSIVEKIAHCHPTIHPIHLKRIAPQLAYVPKRPVALIHKQQLRFPVPCRLPLLLIQLICLSAFGLNLQLLIQCT